MLRAGPAPSVCRRQSRREEDLERRRGRPRSRGSARRTAAGGGASGAVGLPRPARSRAGAGGAAAYAPCLRRPCLPGDAVTDPRGRSSRAALRPLHSAAGAVCRPPCAEVSLQALEDEVSVESVLQGKIAAGRRGLACLACGQHLEVVHSLTGERLSAYRFSAVSQQPPVILALKEFSWQKRVGLLIGLEEAEGSVLCLYDLGVSRVVKAVVLPGRVTAIEPIISHGGASASTQHLHPSLRWLFGVAAVVTDVGQILLVDLCLDDMSCSQNELEASDLEVVTGIPAEVPHIRETVMREGRHLCFQLVSPSGTPVSALRYISRTNQLAVGFSDGYLALWNMKSMKREYYTQLEGGRVPVYAVTFQEPENDPRNCCYLWAVQSTQDSEGDVLSLHLLQLAFGDRKCLASGQVLYEGLEYCEERYTLDLTGGMFPLRGQTSNTKLLGCQSIEKYRYHGDREEGMNEALSPDTSVSVFTWQVNIYGQGKPSMYLGLFDINRWYHAQMPDSLRAGEYLHNCSYFALWSLDSVVNKTYPHYILDILVNERSLSRGIPPSYPPPEQFFNANIYNFDATCLLNSGIVHITCNGFQKETLRFLKKSGASLSEFIPDGYNRCLMAGLLSPRLTDTHPSSLSQEEQLEAILSAAIHTSCLGLLTGCIKKWTKEEQPNSAANLRFVLEWTWNKVVFTKEEFDRLCIPLFDGSCRFIDPQTIQALQQCHLLLSNLNSVLNCFTTEAQEITERGLMDLHKKCLITRLISQYTQAVLWFCHSGLLPEGSDDAVQLSRLYYNYPVIQNYYTSRRQKCERLARGKWNPDCLIIDEMVSQLGDGVERLWKRDEGGTGKYPPSSLHALLDIYLLDDVTEISKHAVTIYLLLDIMYSFPNKADTCIESFPTAFAIPWGQVKLIQGFWLIDHNDYASGLDLLFHPATVKPVSWQHSKIIEAFMSQGEHRQALRYIQTMKPTVSSGEDVTLHLTVLLSNKYMVEAWTFLRQHSTSLNIEHLLTHTYRVCQETGLMEDLLKLPFTELEQDCLVRFLQSSTNVRNHEFLLVHYLQRANYVSALRLNQTLKTNFSNDRDPCLRERSEVRNAIVEQYGKVLPKIQRRLAVEQAKPYHLSTSPVLREVSRPQPLSTVTKQAAAGAVLTRSAFISNVLSKIGEIWACTEPKGGTSASASKSPKREPSPLPHPQVPEAFVGTPILKASQKASRPLDLVVHPVRQPCQRLGFIQQTPKRSPVYLASSSLLKGSHHSPSRTVELHVLETPFVVKRAKTLAMSVTSSGFAEFTPQSILRSGLRTPPLPSPSLSPGRSITPPSRLKETRISFMEESVATKRTPGGTDDSRTKLSVTTPLHKCGGPAKSEWLKNKAKTTAFSLSSPEKDHQEVELRSQDAPSQSLEKLDMSQESSGASTRSDQTTLEYQDAPSPGDLEDSFVALRPRHSSTELIINLTEATEKDSDKDVLESETSPPDLEKETGTVADLETKDLLIEEEVPANLCPLHPIPGGETSRCAPPDHDGKILTLKSQVPVLDEGLVSIETCTSTVRAAVADVHSDSRDSGLAAPESPGVSDHKRDQEITLNLQQEHKVELDVLKASVDLAEEKPPVSDAPPDPQEIHVTEHEKLGVQDSGHEARSLAFNELYPSGTLKLQYNFDTIEQQFCYLSDNKDSAECDVPEVDGELFGAQSNFTLILEGEEGELETGDSAASDVLAPAANTAAEEKPIYSGENGGPGAELATVITSNQESQKVETLPYVPEPIKVAIAENLLDVIKDTRSKEITSDTVEQQSIHENIPLISQQVATKVVKSTLKTVQETSTMTINVSQLDDTISSRTRRRVRVQNPSVLSAQQEESTAVDTPDTLGLSGRRTRKRKEISGSSEGASSDVRVLSQNQQIPQNPGTPRRGRKRTEDNQDMLGSDHPMEQDVEVTPAGKLRRVKPSQLLEPETEKSKLSSVTKKTPKGIKKSVDSLESVEMVEMVDLDLKVSKGARPSGSTRKLRSATLESSKKTGHRSVGETKLSSVTKKTPKGIKKSVDYLESVEMVDLDLKVSKGARPSGSTRKLRSATLEAAESRGHKPDGKPVDQALPAEPGRSPKKRECSTLDVTEDSRLDSSQLSLQAEFGRPRKRGRPRKVNPSEDVGSKAVKEAKSPKRRSGTLSSQKRSTRKTPAKRKTDVAKTALEKFVLVPNEELTLVTSSKKKLTKRTGDPSQTSTLGPVSEKYTDEGTTAMETDNPEERVLAPATPLKSSRSTRTRSSKAISFPDLSEPKNEFVFSTPMSKVPKKEKGKKIEAPAQLQELVSDLSSRFVFSPPALRTRQKTTSNTSRAGDELKDNAPSETVGRPKVKTTRTSKTRQTSRSKEEDNWSPPPVKIRLISPLASPVDGVQIKPRKATAVAGRAPGRGRKKLSSFPKQVLRRKML
ncbi:protein ELYS isoform X3 [Mustela nigripes]|uniref:protein ELYS isoform X3 n=1 Tax=Mustela nigripes TaxID=77151 RepID=UPI0028152D78|nr:protein ELYS isoform X3 [Mustela nigripes]